jgi:hypothetical protein
MMSPPMMSPPEAVAVISDLHLSKGSNWHLEDFKSDAQMTALVNFLEAISTRTAPTVKEKLLASCTDLKRDPYHQGFGLLDIFRLSQSV